MAFCPNCTAEIIVEAAKCPGCGAIFGEGSNWRPLPAKPEPVRKAGEPLYFAVSRSKLAVLSLATLGLYGVYWFYQNWKMEKRGWGWPLVLTAFAPLTAYFLFDAIRSNLVRHGLPRFAAGELAMGVFAFNLCWRLPDPYALISVLYFLPLLVVQHSINRLNAQVAPDAPRNDRYGKGNIAAIVLGTLFWLLVIVGLLLPDPAT